MKKAFNYFFILMMIIICFFAYTRGNSATFYRILRINFVYLLYIIGAMLLLFAIYAPFAHRLKRLNKPMKHFENTTLVIFLLIPLGTAVSMHFTMGLDYGAVTLNYVIGSVMTLGFMPEKFKKKISLIKKKNREEPIPDMIRKEPRDPATKDDL